MNFAKKNSGSKAKVAFVVLVIVVIFVAVYSQSGNSPETGNASDGNASSNRVSASLLPVGLVGVWEGTSYGGELGSFSPTVPFQIDDSGAVQAGAANAKVPAIDVTIEISEEMLARKGFEACWLTLTYRSTNDGPGRSSRDMYRLFPPKDAVSREAEPGERGDAELQAGPVGLPHWRIEDHEDLIFLKKGLDKLQIVKLSATEMHLVGKIGIVGHKLPPRVLLTLQRQVELKSAD